MNLYFSFASFVQFLVSKAILVSLLTSLLKSILLLLQNLTSLCSKTLNCKYLKWTFCNRITFLSSSFLSYLRPYTLSRIEFILFVLFYHWIFLCDDFIVFEFLAVNSWKHLLIQIGGRLPNLFPLKPVKTSLPYISACSDTSRQRLVIPN